MMNEEIDLKFWFFSSLEKKVAAVCGNLFLFVK
jgi:hypothetical protein